MSPVSQALKLAAFAYNSESNKTVSGRKRVQDIIRDHFTKGSYGYLESRHFAIFMDHLLQGIESPR